MKEKTMHSDIAEIYRENRDNVIRFLRSRGYSAADSEDIAQLAFLKVSQLLSRYDPLRARMDQWIIGIARRVAGHVRRANERRANNTAGYSDFLENRPLDTGLISSLDKAIPANLRIVYDALCDGMNGEDCERENICSRATFSRHKRNIAEIAREIAHM